MRLSSTPRDGVQLYVLFTLVHLYLYSRPTVMEQLEQLELPST